MCVIGVSTPTFVGVVVSVIREEVVLPVVVVAVVVIFIGVIVDFKQFGNSCVVIVPIWATCVPPLFGSLCPLYVIRFHLSRECLKSSSSLRQCCWISHYWFINSPSGIFGDGDLVGDATWDALSSSVSCFEPFLVTLFVFCDRAMVSVFVLSSGLSNFVGTVWLFCQ